MTDRTTLILPLALLAVLLGGCRDEEARPANPPVAVGTVVAQTRDVAPVVTVDGEIRARVQSELSFRVAGRMTERLVDVGAHVRAGQVLARLDPEMLRADTIAAEAAVEAAKAGVDQATAAFERQKTLVAQGFTTKRDFGQAEETYRVARGTLDGARAQAAAARELLVQTELRADGDGVITAVRAEVGEVVQAAQIVFGLARDGDRDAVFEVPETMLVGRPADAPPLTIRLTGNPAVTASGRLREISPTVDTATGTVRVTIGLDNPAGRMPLGAAVTAAAPLTAEPRIVVPWRALTSEANRPAVWVVDPASHRIALRRIVVGRHLDDGIAVASGLSDGDRVVAEGSQLLHPGQTVATEDAR